MEIAHPSLEVLLPTPATQDLWEEMLLAATRTCPGLPKGFNQGIYRKSYELQTRRLPYISILQTMGTLHVEPVLMYSFCQLSLRLVSLVGSLTGTQNSGT